jgi:ketosteroid isomerase-like protein
MSDANAEIVRRIYDGLNQLDADEVIELCEDDISMDMSERVFNPDVYRGHEGIRRFCRDVGEAWESYRWDVEETRPVGDSVVVMLHCQGHSREGAPGVDWRVAWLWELRDGRAVSVRFYRDRSKALEAVGISGAG